jgi:hypothetical protein
VLNKINQGSNESKSINSRFTAGISFKTASHDEKFNGIAKPIFKG